MPSMFDNPGAFSPFFDPKKGGEIVRLSGVRDGGVALERSVFVSVFDGGYADPIGDVTTGTDARTMTFLIRKCDWHDARPPQIGDTITRLCGAKSNVSKVDDEIDSTVWTLTARSVK